MNINKRILLCFVCLLAVGSVSIHFIHHSPKYLEQEQMKKVETVHAKDTRLPYTYLNNVIAQSGAACSVYYRSLDTGEVFYNYSGKMPAGDLIRPYVAVGVLQMAAENKLSLGEVFTLEKEDIQGDSPLLGNLLPGSKVTLQNLLEDMLLHNDDTALYKLVAIAGRENLNAWLEQSGYADTVVGTHELPEQENAEDKMGPKEKQEMSYTSVNDTVKLLTLLYQGKCLAPEQNRYLLQLLQRQEKKDLLGALLPREIKIAGQQADHGQILSAGGIVYAREKYILVIMMDKAVRPAEAKKTMNQISSIIFNTVNDKEVFKK